MAIASPGAEFSSIFSLFDLDGDGFISVAEVDHLLATMAGAVAPIDREALREFATEQGEVSLEAFSLWAAERPGFAIANALREIFALVDADNSGALSAAELEVLLAGLAPSSPSLPTAAELLAVLDHNGDGSISLQEFLQLLESDAEIVLSLADLKRLKKTLLQYVSASSRPKVALVEVDCDLGAGIPGAGSGIDMLKQAAARQQSLREVSARLIEEIQGQTRPMARAAEHGVETATTHARHIEAIAAVMGDAAELVASTLRRGQFPLVIAGDHSTAASSIAGIRRAHPDRRLGVVWIDAHADIHSPFTTPSGNMHGMPLAIAAAHDNNAEAINDPDTNTRLLWNQLKNLNGTGQASIALEDLIYVAVRDTEAAEDVTLAAFSIPVISTADVRQMGPERAAQRCLDQLKAVDLIYVSFDVDSMDSTICKGTGTPVPGGLWAEEARQITRILLADPRVCCWEICEINPHLDSLNTLAEVSLGLYQDVLEVLDARL
ncbi:MAG: arginase family protein [Cyanobium sp.]